jgi:DNA invertase Pin-like site-specific DNA recombinase
VARIDAATTKLEAMATAAPARNLEVEFIDASLERDASAVHREALGTAARRRPPATWPPARRPLMAEICHLGVRAPQRHFNLLRLWDAGLLIKRGCALAIAMLCHSATARSDGDLHMRQAAQYLRMSSDKQPFSIAAQEAAIAQYAATNEMSIVATYMDEARSGVSLSGRDAMQRLLSDVMQKNCPFTVILVLDITRWGRFQDVDESAYYEYHCRRCGVEVLYVAEAFRAERPLDSIMKQLKRAMAAEYSRELGVKCRAGVVRAVTSGYAAGSLPCLGYRRQAVAANGEAKQLLKPLERKPAATDRVRWVLGPATEVARVQKIFADFASGKTIAAILRELASEGVTSHSGRMITHAMIHDLLKNPVVLGSFEWGSRSRWRKKRGTGMARLPAHFGNQTMIAPIVDVETWERAQVRQREAIDQLDRGIPAETLIRKLHEALLANPNLRLKDFRRYGLPSASTYWRSIGSVEHAYFLAGATDDSERRLAHSQRRSIAMNVVRQLIRDLLALLATAGVPARHSYPAGCLLVNGVEVVVKAPRMMESVKGERWLIPQLRRSKAPGRWLLLMRLNEDAVTGRDFFLLPPEAMQQFTGKINAKALAGMAKFQICTAPALVHALSELGAQKQLV